VSVSEVLVTGGTGLLGRRVVDRLRVAGYDTRVLSRSGRPGTIEGDLLTGAGLDGAVRNVGAVVHCTSNPSRKTRQTEIGGTQNLLRAAARADVPHVMYVSIVGVDRNPFSYYQAKLATERIIESSPMPWTILRATQFHEYLLRGVRLIERLPVTVAPKGVPLPTCRRRRSRRPARRARARSSHQARAGRGWSGGPDGGGARGCLLRGDRAAAEGLGASIARQDCPCLPRGRAGVSRKSIW
jgi:uncharacterized protein YbjT (DUF2867 family)